MPKPFTVQKGIPIPKRELKYPLRDMQVGDSFYMPARFGRNAAKIVRCHAAYIRFEIKNFRVTVRRWRTGWRVWRIE